jgi:hypothetical protein
VSIVVSHLDVAWQGGSSKPKSRQEERRLGQRYANRLSGERLTGHPAQMH